MRWNMRIRIRTWEKRRTCKGVFNCILKELFVCDFIKILLIPASLYNKNYYQNQNISALLSGIVFFSRVYPVPAKLTNAPAGAPFCFRRKSLADKSCEDNTAAMCPGEKRRM